jgi:hypothetical protein
VGDGHPAGHRGHVAGDGQGTPGSDVVVGTSARSTVAAQLGSGLGLDELFDRQTAASSAELTPGVAIEEITELFVTAMTQPNLATAEKLQKIGAVALSTATVTEPVPREVIARRLPSHDWPDRDLRITAIDTASGELVAFDRTASDWSTRSPPAARCRASGRNRVPHLLRGRIAQELSRESRCLVVVLEVISHLEVIPRDVKWRAAHQIPLRPRRNRRSAPEARHLLAPWSDNSRDLPPMCVVHRDGRLRQRR